MREPGLCSFMLIRRSRLASASPLLDLARHLSNEVDGGAGAMMVFYLAQRVRILEPLLRILPNLLKGNAVLVQHLLQLFPGLDFRFV